MNRMKAWILTSLLLYVATSQIVFGQSRSLSLEDALATGLKNNFSIRIAEHTQTIAKNNNTLGNAGFLPAIGLSGGMKESTVNAKVTDNLGLQTSGNGQNTGTLSLGASLDWTLFNGFEMFIRKDQLSALQSMQSITTRLKVENVLAEISVTYFTVVQMNNSLQVLQNAIDFSRSRMDLTFKKLQIGSGSELSYLKSSTDLNADSAAFLRQKTALISAKSKLNQLLVWDPQNDFDVTTPIAFGQLPSFESLLQVLPEMNGEINQAKLNTDLSMLEYRMTHSPKYPQVDFFADYNWVSNQYNFGTTAKAINSGPVVGLTVNLPVFDGFNKSRISANAKITAEAQKISQEEVVAAVKSDLWMVYNEYRNNLRLVSLETKNLEVARQTIKISFEKFRVGGISDYELREIQLTELEAENSLLAAQLQAKKSETELLRLTGKLVESRK
ncbi:MAG: TolC family protein [Marinilabiliales bacterium]|nr:TolC family protein [Marinilabiliales bacterium]